MQSSLLLSIISYNLIENPKRIKTIPCPKQHMANHPQTKSAISAFKFQQSSKMNIPPQNLNSIETQLHPKLEKLIEIGRFKIFKTNNLDLYNNQAIRSKRLRCTYKPSKLLSPKNLLVQLAELNSIKSVLKVQANI